MKTRIQWLKLSDSPKNLRRLADNLRAEELEEASTSGFLIDQSTHNKLEAQFVERFVKRFEELDPFGNLVEFERIIYNKARFRLSHGCQLLELHNPPRSIGPLINALMRFFPGVTIEPLDSPVMEWVRTIQIQVKGLEIRSVVVSQIQVDDHVEASATFAGLGDVIAGKTEFMGEVKHSIDRVEAAVGSTRLLVTNASKIVLSKEDEEIISEAKTALLKICIF